jgi:hypothetical protein
MKTPKLTLRVDLGSGRALGPGKIRLLEAIDMSGSITQAGRNLGMSYRRAWLLVDDMNNCFRDPVIEAQPGGAETSDRSWRGRHDREFRLHRRPGAFDDAATTSSLRPPEASYGSTLTPAAPK